MKLKFGFVLMLLVLIISGCAEKKTYEEPGAGDGAANPNGITIEGTILKVVETSSGDKKILVAEGDVKDEGDYNKSPITLVQESKYSNLYWVKVESIEGYEAGQKVTVNTKDKPSGNALPYQTEAHSVEQR
ncbi:hypothetical protein CIB95_07005 [Lottiidibacillus patelloidae]|uniref:DUF3221 domain-containing protein n=1 Tax=Lottiidibacillus patelloidae TaxID=2670334 RepID=A0A263BV49_9BACI|nr:DUF3221 domain-containing protein [Lottiidibacillus patelloidae]OZM57207.1 hypothetical protein CIB95_07005 [Lottiidibacillus patelloidae]